MAHSPLPLSPLPHVMLEPLVRATLLEDLGRAGDVTTDAIVPVNLQSKVVLAARQPGVLAGLDLAELAFRLLDPQVRFIRHKQDGAILASGDAIATIEGAARAILTGERTALNFLCRLSGIASATQRIAASVKAYKAQIVCTRKTTPGLRAVEKYAVRAGGGGNHRFGLDDAVLIKDNHIAIAGGLRIAVERARAHCGHMVKIELEVDTLEQLRQALALGVDTVLLDNMTLQQLTEAVNMACGHALTEASGRVTEETAPSIAATGVDLISIGWLTHSAPTLDIGLDYFDEYVF